MQIGKRLLLLVCSVLILFAAFPAISSEAASGPSIVTTLVDNSVQRGSKKTFDVWARNAGGEKIRATVKHNGTKLEPTWDDSEKASYTLNFTEEGENIVTVSASSDGGQKEELTYRIFYRHAGQGEEIGRVIWSVEAFTIGCGYIIGPTEIPIYEGETAADQLLRLLSLNGLCGYYGGTTEASFYLAYIADGDAAAESFNNYSKSGKPETPRQLELSPKIYSPLTQHLEADMTFFDPDDYTGNWVGYLGEFVFTNGSGWMYAVNNVFPNVGFSDSYLSDGDVVRMQFTLAYGADIGGFSSVGTAGDDDDSDTQSAVGYYPVADRDALTRVLCRAQSSGLLGRTSVYNAYEAALKVAETLDASQEAVDAAAAMLGDALEHPSDETQSVQTGSTAEASADTAETAQADTFSDFETETSKKDTELLQESSESNASSEGSAGSAGAEKTDVSETGTGTAAGGSAGNEVGCKSFAAFEFLPLGIVAAAAAMTAREAGARRKRSGRNV